MGTGRRPEKRLITDLEQVLLQPIYILASRIVPSVLIS